jgi:hypothetical protein
MRQITLIAFLLFCGLVGHGQIYQDFQVKTDWENTLDDYIDYSIMVSGDGGKLISDTPKEWLEVSRQYGMLDSVKLAVFPSAGVATRTSTIYNFATKLYDFSAGLRHPTQTTESLQPFISGNIAPNEKRSLKNPNILGNGIDWTIRTSAADNQWFGVTYGNGLFVAVSNTGTGDRVMTSPNGIDWTIRTSAANNSWLGVTYGNGLFVAVAITGTGNRVMTSPNGIDWTIRTSAADNQWLGVTYGNGLFVAVSNTGTGDRVMTSPNGIDWTIRTSAADNDWRSVTYGNGLFVAVSNTGTGNRVMTSPNGIDWTIRTSAADNNWRSVTYGNGLFVAVSNTGTGNRVMTSPNGIDWTIRTSAANNSWLGVTYGNGLFVAVSNTGTGNRVMTSPNGIDWTIRTSAADNDWLSVTYGNGLFVAVSITGTGDRVMTNGDFGKYMSYNKVNFTGTLTIVQKSFSTGKTIVTHTDYTQEDLCEIAIDGELYAYIIRNQTLTASQKAIEKSTLEGLYPEIPSVDIDTLTVSTSNLEMVATPLENVIPNVTLATNTERITATTDRDFSSDTGWWTKGTGVTISGGVANYSAVASGVGLTRANAMTVVRWYKATYTLTVTSGTFRFGSAGVVRSASGTYTEYMKAAVTTLGFNAVTTFTGTLDDVSVSEVGWSDLGNLYTYLTTTGGYTEYNALKEVAAWAYYSNDLTIGSTYGKQYNAYGKYLLKADIATKADWGWHIATEAELTALAVSTGFNLKTSGPSYWNTDNGTNSTGFTALGGGIRNATTGAFEGLKDSTAFWCGDVDKVLMLYDDGTAIITEVDETFGAYIRLIQD